MNRRICLDCGDGVPRYTLRVAPSSSDPQCARLRWERALRTAMAYGAMQAVCRSILHVLVVAVRSKFYISGPWLGNRQAHSCWMW